MFSSLSSILSNAKHYSTSVLEEKLFSFPFINSFINLNGKEYLLSLLNLISLKELSPNETIQISTSSSSFFVFLQGNIELLNTANGKLIEKAIEIGTPIFYSRKTLYDQITVKINSPSLFFEIRTNEYNILLNNIIFEKTQKLQKFISTIKAFPYFQRSKKTLYEKLYQISEERIYKRKEIVYEQDSFVDGLYFITKGNFLISIKQPLLSKEEELKRLDKEIKNLSQEGKILMQCLNGKYGINSDAMDQFKSLFKKNHDKAIHRNNNIILTRNSAPNIYLMLMNENNIFGDFELASKQTQRSYKVQCSSDIGKVIYFPQDKFVEICNESIINKIYPDVIKKAKLMNGKYQSDINIAGNKCSVSNVVNLPIDNGNLRLDRNNKYQTKNNHNIVKKLRTLKTNINFYFTHFDELKKEKHNYLSRANEKEFYQQSKYSLCNPISRFNPDLFNSSKGTNYLAKSFNSKTIYDSKSFGLRTFSNYSNKDLNENISDNTKKSSYYPQDIKQNYLKTGIKYPSSITHNKKIMIFHINERKSNLKHLILRNNLRDITLSIRN